jgi:anaphase-promoting complex subunit 3
MNYYKDHETAIRYLERAIQLDPTSPYLQTLLGLEYTLLKDYDKALLAFQSATNLDPYHFNGWFGLSHLYFQQENWLKAEASVKRSLDLNSHSSIAYTQLAMIQQKQGYFTNALMTIDKALSCNTSNNLPKFHKALILESLGKFNESLKILESLVVGLPKEPSFYKAMSRVLLKLNRPQESILRMAWSMDYSHNSCGLVAGMALVRPHRQHSIENFEIFEDSDFIPHSDESGSFSAENT